MSFHPPSGFVVVAREGAGRVAVLRSGDGALAAWARRVDPERLLDDRGDPGPGGRGSIARVVLDPPLEVQEEGSRERRRSAVALTGPAGSGAEVGHHLRIDGVNSEEKREPGRGSRLVVKKYRRGGALARLVPDLFLGSGRMRADLRVSEQARLRGVPCAVARGLLLDRVCGVLWRGYLVTEEIEGSVTLDRALAARVEARVGGTAGEGALAVAERAVRTVRRLHDAGIEHRDLNIRNLLVAADDVYVIDLDGARTPSRMTLSRRFSNLSRLDRSYLKVLGDRGPLSHGDRVRLMDVYCGDDRDMRGDFDARLTGHKRSLARHRLAWRERDS